MNLIYREIQIYKNINFNKNKKNRVYGPSNDIFEEHNISYLNKSNLNNVIENYKVFNKNRDNNLDEYWLYINNSDRRRKLLKDENYYYNYLPLLNIRYYGDYEEEENDYEDNEDNEDNSIYAKNQNELLYHSLYYKTILCRHCNISEGNNEENELCPYSHNILKDFRIIFDYKNDNIIKFMKLLIDSKLFQFENYLNFIPRNLTQEFNLDTFKIHECLFNSECPNDYLFCPYYHKSIEGDEMRRPPSLFQYSGARCDKCFDLKKRKYCPKKCDFGIFCKSCHSENEYNYHKDHFRKEIKCKDQANYGKCPNYKACYKIHFYDENENEEEEEEEEINIEEIEEDEEISDINSKVANAVKIGKFLRCRKCQLIQNELCYFIECNHFICIKCFKLLNKNINKKKNKEISNNTIISCPFCGKELKKNSVVLANFDKKYN